MARSDLLIPLVQASMSGDKTAIRSAVEAIIADEKRKQHNLLADKLTGAMHTTDNGGTATPSPTSAASHRDRRLLIGIKLQFAEIWIRNNMSFLDRYWSTARTALEFVEHAPADFEEFAGKDLPCGYVSGVVSEHLQNHNRAAVLLTYATFEEFFNTLTPELGLWLGVSTKPSDLRDRGVRRYKKFIHQTCQIDADTLTIDWGFLGHFSIVRNFIIHANGNKNLSSKAQALDGIVKSYPNELSFEDEERLRVSDAFVERCMQVTKSAALDLRTFMMEYNKNTLDESTKPKVEGSADSS